MHKAYLAAAGILTASLLAAPVVAGHLDDTARVSATPRGVDGAPVILTAADQQLPAYAGCADLRDWYVAKALPMVGPYGFGWGMPYLRSAAGVGVAPQPATASSTTFDSVGVSATGTNVQEEGVDEPDFAKTDGSRIVRLQARHLVVTDVAGATPRELGSTALPAGVYADRLLLDGHRVLVFAHAGGGVLPAGPAVALWGGAPDTELLSYDITDPAAPRLVDRVHYDANLIEARQYDDTVRLVLGAGLPRLDFVTPTKRRTPAEATRINKRIVRESTIDDWLPSAVHDGRRSPLVDCSDVRHPAGDTGFGTLTIVTFRTSDPVASTAVAVTTDSTLAYSSADHLYVATNNWRPMLAADAALAGASVPTTRIYAFDLDGDDTTYAGSGTVPGWIADRWSMDEHDGYLRVATHVDGERGGSNRITVLGPDASGRLTEVGAVGDLGPREQLQAVRWFDDLAVLVTFRQRDPLYTVDLADPAHPRTLGELKIPGFSSYLHPIGGGQLLGLGTSTTARGVGTGAQLATFDITDLSAPARVGRLQLGRGSYLPATGEPHAFLFVPGHRTMLTSVYDRQGRTRIVEVQVAADGTLTERASYRSRYDVRMLPIGPDRVALVGNIVRLVGLP